MKILELRLATNRLSGLRDFYLDTLDFPLLGETDESFTLGAGNTRLTFTVEAAALYHIAFNIPENQFGEAKQWLSKRVPLMIFQGKDEVAWPAWNAHALYFSDPAGNIMEFIARHNLPNMSLQSFGSRSIREVSEVGLPVANVRESVNTVQSRLGIGVFDAGDGETFTALGDEHGLFITVKRGRAWFPTSDRYADFYPLGVKLQGTQDRHVTLAGLPYEIETT